MLGTLTATLQTDHFTFKAEGSDSMRRAVAASLAALARSRPALRCSPRRRAGAATPRPRRRRASSPRRPTWAGTPTSRCPAAFPETKILQEADRLKTTGLETDGYRLIWLDAGWWQGQRDAAGNMVVSPTQWPHGIAWLAATLHANGFKLGVYTDAGMTGCGVKGGMYGHYQQDINTLASWGVDAIKVDWCGGAAAGPEPVGPVRPDPSGDPRRHAATARCS